MAQAVTRAQLQEFVELCRRRYEAKRIDPGPQAEGRQGLECSVSCVAQAAWQSLALPDSSAAKAQHIFLMPPGRTLLRGMTSFAYRKDPCSVLYL
jgi:hypothetical protein